LAMFSLSAYWKGEEIHYLRTRVKLLTFNFLNAELDVDYQT
jgi:hypothetical protein